MNSTFKPSLVWCRVFLSLFVLICGIALTGSSRLPAVRAAMGFPEENIVPAAFQTVGPNINISRRLGNDNEATIFINPVNPNQLIALSNIGGGSGLFKAFSVDGGVNWTTDIIADGDGLGTACCDPQASGSFDTFGNFFLTYLDNNATRIQTAISTDGGANFIFLATVDTGNVDQPSISAGAGTVWVSYRDDAGTISASGANVTGLGAVGAFSAPQVAPGSAGGNFGDVAVRPGGGVMVTYQMPSGGEGPATIFVNFDADGMGAGGFGAQVTATTTNVGGFDFIPPQAGRSVDAEAGLVYDRSGGARNGRVYLVYTDEVPSNESNDTDIFVRFSDDNGANWSARVRVNDDTTTRCQFNPRIALDQTTGNIAVSWHDSRNDTGSGAGDTNGVANDDAQFFATFSLDGGATFLPNIQVSAGTSNSNASGSGIDYGDYTGLTFHNGIAFPVWADNSNSTNDNPDGTLFRFDVYTAAINLCGLTCPANIVVNNTPGQCGATVNFPAPVTSGACGPVTCSHASGAFFPVGVTAVTCSSTSGPACSFTVTVIDNENPVISCPANITAMTDPGACSAAVNPGAPTVNDNCAGATVAGSRSDGMALNAPYPKGVTTITWKATDASGNMSSCLQTITVMDKEKPKIDCPDDVVAVTENPGDMSVTVTYDPPVVSDNCPGVMVACSIPSGGSFPLGVTTVTCTATDASSNTESCSFKVTVFDVCIEDDQSGDFLLFNSFTGDYRFTKCGVDGFVMTGRGRITRTGSSTLLEDDTRVVFAELIRSTFATGNSGSARIRRGVLGATFVINDSYIFNNNCKCQ